MNATRPSTATIARLTFLALVLILGAFLRLHRITEYANFQGDEGRDARIVRDMITTREPVLLGPTTSVGGSAGQMYLGPLYYWMMAPALSLSGGNPVGPAIMVAIVSIATIALIFRVGEQWRHPAVGLIAALLYAISPRIIEFSRWSWNPNVMPFFALLAIYAIGNVWRQYRSTEPNHLRAAAWLVTAGLAIGAVTQFHYLGLLLAPTLALTWLATLLLTIRTHHTAKFLLATLGAFAACAASLSPLIIYDLQHDYQNLTALTSFLAEREPAPFYTDKFLTDLTWMGVRQIHTFITAKVATATLTITALLWFIAIHHIRIATPSLKARAAQVPNLALLFTWITFGILGATLYGGKIYDHYLSFIFPAITLLIAWAIWHLANAGHTFIISRTAKSTIPIRTLIATILTAPIVAINIAHHPFTVEPSRHITHTTQIAELIRDNAAGQPINFSLLSRTNYDQAHIYTLEQAEVQIDTNPATQLFVVCEDTDPPTLINKRCNPTNSSLQHINFFGPAQITEEWSMPWGDRIYKLTPQQ